MLEPAVPNTWDMANLRIKTQAAGRVHENISGSDELVQDAGGTYIVSPADTSSM
jgi:hypothetical protein